MKNSELENKKIAIIGFGTEGLAVAIYLRNRGISNFTILDRSPQEEVLENTPEESRDAAKSFLDDRSIEKRFGKAYLDKVSDFNLIFRSPGISLHNQKLHEAKQNGAEITSQIKLFFELCPCTIIGVTGTKGKGTTSSLIYEILKNYFQNTSNTEGSSKSNIYLAGNIGYPALTLLDDLKPDDYVILELSSFQLMDLHCSPHIAVITNLTVDHLDYHKDIAEYQDAKKSLLRYQGQNDYAIINANSTFNSHFINSLAANVKFFSTTIGNAEAIIKDDKVILDPLARNKEICCQNELKIFGKHNLENIAAASLVADVLGVDADFISGVVKQFSGLPHRIELAAQIDGVKYINDSFATNPAPTMAAVSAFTENKLLILGGSSKGADFSELTDFIASQNVKVVFLIGTEAAKIRQNLKLSNYSGQVIDDITDINLLVAKAKEIAESGDVVLFSPACASFDMFKNYKDRGEKFKAAVNLLHNP